MPLLPALPTENQDFGDALGIYNSLRSVWEGKRNYAAVTYYEDNAARTNFVVLTGAQVCLPNKNCLASESDCSKATKLLFGSPDHLNRQVTTGVQFVSNSQIYNVTATREVILSAGRLPP